MKSKNSETAYSMDDISQHGAFNPYMEQLEGEEDMAKRTPDNCSLIKKIGEPGKGGNVSCMRLARSRDDDEPCEACKKCKYCTSCEE